MEPLHTDASRRLDPRRSVGATGEEAAARHLASLGYRVLGRNVKAGGVEVDIVALAPDGAAAVVEVKSRTGPWHPEDRVDALKRERMVRAASVLSGSGPLADRLFQFDVVAVEVRADGSAIVTHWPRAFDSPH